MNEARLLGRWALVVALSASCAFACGDDDDDGPTGSAGSGGKGGSGGSAGSGGKGGSGGTAAGSGGAGADGGMGGGGGSAGQVTNVEWCGPYPLEDLCEGGTKPCPDDLDALLARDFCENPGDADVKVSRFETTCAGTIIVADYELYSTEWEFDEDGQLLSVLNHTDSVVDCGESGVSSASVLYGTKPCARTDAEPEVVCAAGGEGGAGGAGGVGAGGGGAGGAEN